MAKVLNKVTIPSNAFLTISTTENNPENVSFKLSKNVMVFLVVPFTLSSELFKSSVLSEAVSAASATFSTEVVAVSVTTVTSPTVPVKLSKPSSRLLKS